MKIQIKYLHEGMTPLKRSHTYDAGADVSMWEDTVIRPGKNMIPLGFKAIIPPGYAGYLSPRSSVMANGVIYSFVPVDSDYTGEIHLCIYNPGEAFTVKKDERLCQFIIMPVLIADFVEDLGNRRGENGLGSTGK